MTPEEFRTACFTMIARNEMRPGYLIEKGLAQRLNVVFDIDHTLVHSVQPYQIGGVKKAMTKAVNVSFGKTTLSSFIICCRYGH